MCWLVISPFCDFFAVLDVSFAVNLCINCSFLHLYLYKCKKKLLLYNNVSISIQQTKFCRDVSIGGWDITTSGFEIQTSAIFTFYFLFRPRPFRRKRRVILHPAAEFRPNRNIRRWNMTSYWFSRWRLSAMLYLLWGNGGPRSAFRGLNSDLKSLVRRINISGDIVM